MALKRRALTLAKILNSLSLRMRPRVSSGDSAAPLLCLSHRQVVAHSRKSNTPAAQIRIQPYILGSLLLKGSVFAETKAPRTRDGGWLAFSSSALRVASAWSRFLAALAVSYAEASGRPEPAHFITQVLVITCGKCDFGTCGGRSGRIVCRRLDIAIGSIPQHLVLVGVINTFY